MEFSSMQAPGRASIVIVGSGLAGAATAFALGERGHQDILLVDQAAEIGSGASGHNAGMIRQRVSPASISRIAETSARRYAELARERGLPFEATGSLLVGKRPQLETLLADASDEGRGRSEIIEGRALKDMAPALALQDGQAGLWTPSDGFLDGTALIRFFLEAAECRSVRRLSNCRVEAVRLQGSRVTGVETEMGPIETNVVVDARGAWFGGLVPTRDHAPIRSYRRHIFVTVTAPEIPALSPFVWDLDRDFYYRPFEGGAMLCVCDGEPIDPSFPGISPEARAVLRQKVEEVAPSFADHPLARGWAGARSFAEDDAFILGPCEQHPGLFYAGALGGHGVTCAIEVGRLVAAAIDGETPAALSPFLPSRFRETGIKP